MSVMEAPRSRAFDRPEPRYEWDLYLVVSIPASLRVSVSHLAMVGFDTPFFVTHEMKRGFELDDLNSLVLLIYASTWDFTHNSGVLEDIHFTIIGLMIFQVVFVLSRTTKFKWSCAISIFSNFNRCMV